MGNTIDDSAGGPNRLPKLLLDVLTQIAESNLNLRPPSEAVDAGEAALEDNDFFHAQYNAFDARAIIEDDGENKDKNAPLLQRANKVLESVREKSPAPKLNPGETIKYDGPVRIGDHLWICKKDHWPPLMADQLISEVGYAIFDLDTLTSFDGEYVGMKALRDGETVELSKIIDERISPESAEPNCEIRIKREGDTIKVLSDQEVSAGISKLLDSGETARIARAKTFIDTQLKGELTEPERRQLLVDLAAIEAKLKETGELPKE